MARIISNRNSISKRNYYAHRYRDRHRVVREINVSNLSFTYEGKKIRSRLISRSSLEGGEVFVRRKFVLVIPITRYIYIYVYSRSVCNERRHGSRVQKRDGGGVHGRVEALNFVTSPPRDLHLESR